MAKVFLDTTDTGFTVSNNNTQVYGASGDQVLTVASGVTGVEVDQNVEGVVFSGASSDYAFKSTGNMLLVYNAAGTQLLATIPVQMDTNGTQMTFSNGTTDAVLQTTGGNAGKITIGGTAAPSGTAADPAPVTPGDIGGGTPAPTYALSASATSLVAEGGDITFTVTPSAASETATTLYVQISGASVGAITAQAAAGDFSAVLLPVTIPAGSTAPVIVSTTVSSDGVTEGPEGFQARLLDSGFNVMADVTAITGTITEGVSSGQTFTLTTAADNITGTSGNDSIVGTLPYAGTISSAATLTPGDQINGGAGVDTFSITVSGADLPAAATATISPVLTGIEKVLVANVASEASGTDYQVIDLSLTDSALTTVGTSASTAAGVLTKFTNVATLVDVEMAGKGNLEIDHATAAVTAGAADAVNITLKGVGANATTRSTLTFTDNGIETVNVNGTTLANYVTIANDGIKTLNVTGDKSVYVAVNETTTKVDTSAATAAVTVEIETGVGTLSNVTVTGGAATTDALIFNDNIAAATDLKNVSGVETIGLNKANGTITLAAPVTGVSTFDLSSVDKQTLTLNAGYTGDTTVKIGVSSTGGAGVSDDVVTNNANVNLTVTGNVANFNTAAITGGTGTDTLNMSADAGAADLSSISNGATTLIDQINILASTSAPASGATLTGYTNATGKTTNVDASALTSSSAVFSFTVGNNNAGNLNVTGGAGNDVIDLSTGTYAGKATVSGGAGNDSITVDAGAHSIDGGAGNDTITVSGAMSSSLTINGGDGTDTLVVDSLSGTTPMVNVTNVENVAFSNNATSISLTSALGTGVTLDLSQGTANTTAQSLTLASGYTGDTTVKVGTTVDSVTNSANVALTVTGTTVASFNNAVIAGGTGTDTIKMVANDDTAALGSVTGVESIVITANTTDATKDASLTAVTSAASKTLTVDASALTNSTANFSITAGDTAGSLSIIGGAGNDTINLGSATTGTAVTHYVSAGAGVDNITGSAGKDSIDAGAGNDTITMGANLDFNDTIDGGDGTDTLSITAVASGMLAHVKNVEVLKIDATTSVSFGSDAVGFNTFDLSGNFDTNLTFAAGFTGDTTVALGTDTGNVITNSANVALKVTGNVASFNASIVGGTGSDTLEMTANSDTVTLHTGTTGIDSIVIKANTADATKTAGVTLGAAQVVKTGGTLVVDASNLVNSSAAFTFDGSPNTGTGKMSIIGGAGSDSLTGDDNADTIDGGAGNDYIKGGKGIDQITTGSGYDVVAVTGNSNSLTYATVTDFAAGDALELYVRGTPSTVVPTKLSLGAGATSLSDYVNAALAANGGTNGVLSWFQFGGNTYVVVDNNTGGFAAPNGTASQEDAIICLQGEIDLSASTIRTAGSNTVYWQLGATATAIQAPGASSAAFTFTGTTAADYMLGSTGADTFNFAVANFSSNDTVTGNGGADKIVMSDGGNDAVIDADFTRVTGVQTLELNGASTITLGALANTAGITTVKAGAGNTTVTSSGITALTVDAAAMTGANTLTLSGSTNFTVTNTAQANPANITATGSTGTLHATFADDTTNSAITVAAGNGNTTIVGGAADDTITVTGLATASQTFTGSVAKFDVSGGAGAQAITTGTAADTILGGAGADQLTGGGGADYFKYALTSEGGDAITDFVSGDGDKIYLAEAAFTLGVAWNSHALDATTNANNYAETATALSGVAQDLNGTGAAGGAGIVVVGAGTGTAGVAIYYTTDIGAATDANSTLIATLTGLNTGNIAATDFLGY